jgi:hypothetical protein
MNRLIAFSLLWILPGSGQDLSVGRASVAITPPVGAPIGSSYGLTISTGVRDDLYAKAIVMESGGRRVAILSADLISLRPELVAEVRDQIRARTGLTADQVIIYATHTHCGPQLHPPFLDLIGGETAQLGREYRSALPHRLAEAVQLAIRDLRPARAWVGRGAEKSLVFNRRFHMKDGSVRMNPGVGNPDIVREAAGTDPDVHVVYFDTPQGEPLAVHVTYSLHVAVAGGPRVTADYPGKLARMLRDAKGEQLLTVFTIGTAGDINHINVRSREKVDGLTRSDRIGSSLAKEVLRVMERPEPVSGRLAAARLQVKLPARSFEPSDVEKAEDLFSRYGSKDAPRFHEVVWAWRVLDLHALKGQPFTADVQVIALGDRVAWVGLPGEIFVDLGLAVKRASPFRHTIVSGMAGSGTISYVPTGKAFSEGSYEVISARTAPGGGEVLVDAALQLLRKLHPR